MSRAVPKESILELVSKSKVEDYDGHTDFQKLTPKQKLIWLSNTAYFVFTAGKNNPDLGCSRFINFPSYHSPKYTE